MGGADRHSTQVYVDTAGGGTPCAPRYTWASTHRVSGIWYKAGCAHTHTSIAGWPLASPAPTQEGSFGPLPCWCPVPCLTGRLSRSQGKECALGRFQSWDREHGHTDLALSATSVPPPDIWPGSCRCRCVLGFAPQALLLFQDLNFTCSQLLGCRVLPATSNTASNAMLVPCRHGRLRGPPLSRILPLLDFRSHLFHVCLCPVPPQAPALPQEGALGSAWGVGQGCGSASGHF